MTTTPTTRVTRRQVPGLLTRMAAYEVAHKRKAVSKGWEPVGTCIGTTRFAVNLLRSVGVRVEVVPVSMFVTNDPYRRAEHEGVFDRGSSAATDARREHWVKQGAHSIWVGRDIGDRDPGTFFIRDTRNPSAGWDGHLVMVVDRSWLVDLTLWQARRKTLLVPETLILAERGKHLTQGGEVIVQVDDKFGTEVSYVRIEDDHYLRAKDWVQFPPTSPMSREWSAGALAFDA